MHADFLREEPLSALRHALHRHPELGGRETETMRRIREFLADLRVEVLPPFIGTDTVALCRGKTPGRCITLRADIDALPVAEETHLPFASEIPGVMHACGHDVHTAILLGTAAELCRCDFSGTIRFVWQPGEEKYALGKKLIDAGALENPAPDAVFSLHVSPDLPFGVIGCRAGTIMASSIHFEITVTGQGGHGSAPQKTVSPILAAAEITLAMEKLAAQYPDSALSIGVIRGGAMENVIPDVVTLAGTLRTLTDDESKKILDAMRQLCQNTDHIRRTGSILRVLQAYPTTVNDPAAVEKVRQSAEKTGSLSYMEMADPKMTAEDFSFYLQRYRGAMFHLGIGDTAPLHSGKISIPDEIIPYGVEMMVKLALNALRP